MTPVSRSQKSNGHRLGPWRVDLGHGTVSGRGEPRQLSTRAAAVLACLLEHPGQILSHREIARRAWPENGSDEKAVSRYVSEIRKALDDDPAAPTYIETHPGEGYRLIASVVPVERPVSRPSALATLALVLASAAVLFLLGLGRRRRRHPLRLVRAS